MQLVSKVIDEEIRPSLKKDGGDIELIDIEGQKVVVALRGACIGCPSSHRITSYNVCYTKLLRAGLDRLAQALLHEILQG